MTIQPNKIYINKNGFRYKSAGWIRGGCHLKYDPPGTPRQVIMTPLDEWTTSFWVNSDTGAPVGDIHPYDYDYMVMTKRVWFPWLYKGPCNPGGMKLQEFLERIVSKIRRKR